MTHRHEREARAAVYQRVRDGVKPSAQNKLRCLVFQCEEILVKREGLRKQRLLRILVATTIVLCQASGKRQGDITMPEGGGSNIEVAHHLSEHEEPREYRMPRTVEIVEGIVLAIVAITTAWSGYQAALWTGHQSKLYSVANRLRVQAGGAEAAANYERLYNAATVAQWLQAETDGKKKLAALYERRFFPEFRPAFDAWKKTDPLNNPNAPPGPFHMPEYRSYRAEEAARLAQQSSDTFEQGDLARHRAD